MNTNLIILLFCAFVWLVSVAVIVYMIIGIMKISKQEKEEQKYFRENFDNF